MKKSVVILGGGLSGLSVTWGLAGSDYEVHIIEKEDAVGGLAGSFIKNGYTFDYGIHNFYTKDAEIYYKVKELIKDEFLPSRGIYSDRKIIFRGQEYDYPLKATSILKNMKLSVSLQCLFDYIKSIYRRNLYKPSYITSEDWMINHFGKGLYDNFFCAFTEKTWGISPKKMSADFASERIPKLSIRKMIKQIFNKKQNRTNADIYSNKDFNPTSSYYPPKGCWMIGDSIKKEIETKGAKIHLRSRAKSLNIENGHICTAVFEKNGSIVEIRPDFVVSTIPITELINIIDNLDEETRNAGTKMRYRELIFLFLEVNKPRVFNAMSIYFHDSDVIFQRGSEIKWYSDKTVPSKNKTSLILEITNKDNLEDSKIYEESVKALEKKGYLLKEEIENHYIVHKPHAYPIYDLNYKSNLEVFMKGISKIDNLFSSGRQALFRYIDMDQCIKMGLIVAQHILGDKPLDELDTVISHWSEDALKSDY